MYKLVFLYPPVILADAKPPYFAWVAPCLKARQFDELFQVEWSVR
jgi:hypothetical protein